MKEVKVYELTKGINELDLVIKSQVLDLVNKEPNLEVEDLMYVVIGFETRILARQIAKGLASNIGKVYHVFMGNEYCYVVSF